MRHDIFERAIVVMKAVTTERRRYKELEEETGIPATNWQSAAKRKQRPTAHMIEALSRRWPKYAFWLATGLTDPAAGHTAPGIWASGERTSGEESELAASRYFDAKLLLQDLTYGPSDATERYYATRGGKVRSANHEEGDTAASTAPAEPANAAQAPKYKDLDAAIAELAFERRLQHLKEQFSDALDQSGNMQELKRLIAEFEFAKATSALEESRQILSIYQK
ncbi:hypothetical protein B0G71_3864 [Paraburkholderia sp. BL27I4N3]|uniref:hypothetical protein n=1 Tax=Paraburkholderia sp. BL27I4N3 TaxID=1938805 RepID=UPI000E2760C4|nr:hypothetical protein [Paraburkholderia sp. BL27I4N3]REE20726.1 hypothetical protein B0G71_3864 [Paraburkholderia sp. BL27I4N3]